MAAACAAPSELLPLDCPSDTSATPETNEDVFGRVTVPFSEGEYYFYTDSAIYHTEDYGETVEELTTSGWSGDIKTLAVDNSGNLYLGTSKGVYLSTDKTTFTKIATSSSESSSTVTAIYPRSTESVLVGTAYILIEVFPESRGCEYNGRTLYITNGYCYLYYPFNGRNSFGSYNCGGELYVSRFIPKWNRSSDVSAFTPEVLIVTDEGTFYSADAGDSFEPLPSSVTITHGNWMDSDSAYFWDERDSSKLWTVSADEFQLVEENLEQDAGMTNINDALGLGGRIYIATDNWLFYNEEGTSIWDVPTSPDLPEGELPPVDFLMGQELENPDSNDYDDYEMIGLSGSWDRYHLTWSEGTE